MKDKAKLTELLIESMRPRESESIQEDTPVSDSETVDIDALENRIIEKIESKLTKPESSKEVVENPVTESNE